MIVRAHPEHTFRGTRNDAAWHETGTVSFESEASTLMQSVTWYDPPPQLQLAVSCLTNARSQKPIHKGQQEHES